MSQKKSEVRERVLAEAVASWNRTFGGVSALDIARRLEVSHQEVRRCMESLVEDGLGTINADVELYCMSLAEPRTGRGRPYVAIKTHIFFPSKDVLTEHFLASGQAAHEHPEFKKRLMCGGHQMALAFFSEDVLARYFDHLDYYDIDDSLAGGRVSTKGNAPESRYLDVRFGKGRSHDGQVFVTAILKDLSHMTESEQRYWHAHEIARPDLDPTDENFRLFTARTYGGEWVDFPNPIRQVQASLARVNDVFESGPVFGRLQNEHLRVPVENTNKALFDCCSELYKIVGPDSLKKGPLQEFLRVHYKATDEDFVHESGRPLSAVQTLALLESKLDISASLSSAINGVGKYRVAADHKVVETESSEKSYTDIFVSLCRDVTEACDVLAEVVDET